MATAVLTHQNWSKTRIARICTLPSAHLPSLWCVTRCKHGTLVLPRSSSNREWSDSRANEKTSCTSRGVLAEGQGPTKGAGRWHDISWWFSHSSVLYNSNCKVHNERNQSNFESATNFVSICVSKCVRRWTYFLHLKSLISQMISVAIATCVTDWEEDSAPLTNQTHNPKAYF